jgi:gliding motility-associated-like protein
MKKMIFIMPMLLFVLKTQAHHIVGGEMYYTYLGKGTAPNTSRYQITLKIFRDQNVPPNTAPMPTEVYIGIYNNDNSQEFKGPNPYYIVQKESENTVPVNPFPPCMTNSPSLDYHVGLFEFTVELPDNINGYTAAFQTCCRVDDLENVSNFGGSETGSTFTCTIPPNKYMDSSPEFSTSIDVICAGKKFQLQYSATDKDNDSLVYSFTPAFDGGAFHDDKNANPAGPPYSSVFYINSYTDTTPLGGQAFINTKTGIVSGIAPPLGKYVLSVMVSSYRNGVLINMHQKDFIVNVTDCDFAGAQLNPKPVICDSFNVSFQNDNPSSLNQNFYWDFGDPKSGANNTSILKTPTHVFTDTGVFIYKLVVNRGQQCSDSMTQVLKLYPGFYPAFDVDGQCVNSSILFTDKTSTNFGFVNGWSWHFGDIASTSDSSNSKNPSYIYTQAGNYQVQLTAENSKGCSKSISQTVSIKTQPDFSVNHDTLICSIDTLQLTAIGKGSVSWTPEYNINNVHSFTPLVSPKVPTTYYATLNESRGCIATDSIFVNVINKVSLNLKPDTTICLTDTAVLKPESNGLHYLWTSAGTTINDTAKNIQVVPAENTIYHLVSSIGKCNTAGNILVKAVPYPKANAGNDTTVCFPATLPLHASGGSIYTWTPGTFLNNSKIANPVSSPQQSIEYTVQVNDVLGCPKPAFASIKVTIEKLVADAGPRDTSIVVGQPLQLSGSGGQFYFWTPSEELNNTNIANPVALLSDNEQFILKVQSLAGCTAQDTINVTVYKIKPDLYVPDAFTPNADGKNDIFRPIAVGMKSLDFFRVYNRLGQLIFSSNVFNQGWDGTFNGKPQDPGVFVWIAQGTDYLGKRIFRKGSVTLLR